MQAEVLETVGRYEIIGDLGAGSMSRVYLAHDPNLDRKVALKVVLQGFSLDNREQSELERRFLLEARAAGKLSHPGIVRVYDADTDPGLRIPYIAMEWVQGRSLRDLLEDGGRLSGSRTLEILGQVALALDYAHRAGRIHRDIKPSNILIGSDGKAKVSDFGVAKIVSETHTVSGQVLGTPSYMSPEQVRDDPLDGRSDLFSLGAVLYQCIAGNTPFGGESLVQVVYKILNVDPRPLQLPSTPALSQLVTAVERSLHKDPNSRFQTGSEFADVLDQIRAQLEADPRSDFRADHRGRPPRSPSDTVPNLAAQTGRSQVDSAGTGGTHTVRLSTASIHAVTEPGNRHATVASPPPPSDTAPVRRARLSFVAALALALTALGVSAVFRLSREDPPLRTPIEISRTVAFEASSQTLDRSTSGSGALDLGAAGTVPLPPDPELSATGSTPSPSVLTDEETEVSGRPVSRGAAGSASPRASSTTVQSADIVSGEPTSQAVDPSVPAARTPDPAPRTSRSDTSSTAVNLTPVTILYKHKGGRAFLSIFLDGVRVWSQDLKPVLGRRQKWTGYEARAVVPVSPGTHTLEVSLHDPDRGIEASSSLRSRYTNGTRRTLRVVAEPKSNSLQLRWKE